MEFAAKFGKLEGHPRKYKSNTADMEEAMPAAWNL